MADPAKLLFRDPSYDGQLSRTLAAATVGAADLGEALATARRIGRPSRATWHDAWSATAEVARRTGTTALEAGDRASARQAFLRASEYFRQAYYFVRTDIHGPLLQRAYRAHVDSFVAAVGLMEHPARQVRIPFETTSLVGYFFEPDDTGADRPTLLFPCGYDSTAEAGWVNVPRALARGYNVLVFEGPGQGEALYVQQLFFRPDFEAVVTPVLDWLLAQPHVDATRVVLVGRSFAGYLAPRAAAFDTRLAGLVCDPAQPDMGAKIPGGLAGRLAVPFVTAQCRVSADRAEFFGARMAGHGISSLAGYFAELRRFDMLPDAHRITCPTLIVEAEGDFAGGQGSALAAALRCPVELIHLTRAQGADGHCAGLGQDIWAETVFGWMARLLRPALPDPPGPGGRDA